MTTSTPTSLVKVDGMTSGSEFASTFSFPSNPARLFAVLVVTTPPPRERGGGGERRRNENDYTSSFCGITFIAKLSDRGPRAT